MAPQASWLNFKVHCLALPSQQVAQKNSQVTCGLPQAIQRVHQVSWRPYRMILPYIQITCEIFQVTCEVHQVVLQALQITWCTSRVIRICFLLIRHPYRSSVRHVYSFYILTGHLDVPTSHL